MFSYRGRHMHVVRSAFMFSYRGRHMHVMKRGQTNSSRLTPMHYHLSLLEDPPLPVQP
jgi:hypothetical protein